MVCVHDVNSNEIKNLEKKNIKLETRLKNEISIREEKDRKIQEMQGEIDEKEKENKQYQSDIEQMKNELNEKNNQIKEKNNQLQQYHDIERRNEEIEQDLEKLKSQYQTQLERKEKERELAQTQLETEMKRRMEQLNAEKQVNAEMSSLISQFREMVDKNKAHTTNGPIQLTSYKVCKDGFDLFLESKLKQLKMLEKNSSNGNDTADDIGSTDCNTVVGLALNDKKQLQSMMDKIDKIIENETEKCSSNKSSSTSESVTDMISNLMKKYTIAGVVATTYATLIHYFELSLNFTSLDQCSKLEMITRTSILVALSCVFVYLKCDDLRLNEWKKRISKSVEDNNTNTTINNTSNINCNTVTLDINDNDINTSGDTLHKNQAFGYNKNQKNFLSMFDLIKLKFANVLFSFFIWILFAFTIDATIIECFINSTVESATIMTSTLFLAIIFTISKYSSINTLKDKLQSGVQDDVHDDVQDQDESNAIEKSDETTQEKQNLQDNDETVNGANVTDSEKVNETTALLKGVLSKKIYL